jgi:transcriptional regulator with XRE-family HTH domain
MVRRGRIAEIGPMEEGTTDRELQAAFASRLRDARLRRGFKVQAEFARLLGVSETRYNNWERGQSLPSSIAPFKRMCELLGATADYLLFGHIDGLSRQAYADLVHSPTVDKRP